jgi:hypothetical protein
MKLRAGWGIVMSTILLGMMYRLGLVVVQKEKAKPRALTAIQHVNITP